MTDTGYITRDRMPDTHLNLFIPWPGGDPDFPIYDIAEGGLNPGTANRRRAISEAMWIPGASQLGSSPAMATATWTFIVTGPDKPSLDLVIGALVEAVYWQPSWELHVNFGGLSEWAWTCWDADEPTIGMAASFWGPDASTEILWTTVAVTAMRDPLLVAGPYNLPMP